MSWHIWSWKTLSRAVPNSKNTLNSGFRIKRKVLPVVNLFLKTNAVHKELDSEVPIMWPLHMQPESQAQHVQDLFTSLSTCLSFYIPSLLRLSPPTLSLKLGTLTPPPSVSSTSKCLWNISCLSPLAHCLYPSLSAIISQWDHCSSLPTTSLSLKSFLSFHLLMAINVIFLKSLTMLVTSSEYMMALPV